MTTKKHDLSTLLTAATAYGENDMFTIRAGIPAEEALLYACHLLKSAAAIVSNSADNLEPYHRASVLGATQPIESARAFIESVMEGAGVERLFSY